MFDHILTTKLHIAPVPPTFVARARLVEHLDERRLRRLTLVVAPPGSGKTTLVQQMISRLALSVAWLSLDEGDNDRKRFFLYLIAALQTIDASLGETTSSFLQSPHTPPPDVLMTPLINDLNILSQPIMLVLDEVHLIENLDIHKAIAFLLDHAPPSFHLVMISREDPPIPMGRLRVAGELLEIRAHDLRFTVDEASMFFSQTMALELDPETVAALERRTEGWIAGLQMAALSMRNVTDIHEFVEAFAGDNRFVADYLVSEVLDHQPEHIRDFLLQTAVLSRFTSSLCDALVETSSIPSREMIKQIETLGLFLIPLDHSRQWYRYHGLFTDLLSHRLRYRDPARFAQLHQKASRWFHEHGFTDEAIHHALMGEAFEQAADMVEEVGLGMFGRSQLLTLKNWIAALPETLMRARPYLSVLLVWIGAVTGQRELARENLVAAAERLDRVSLSRRNEILCHITLLRAYAARSGGEIATSTQFVQEALRYLPENNVFLDCTIHLNLGGNYWLTGEFLSLEEPLKRASSFAHISEVEYPALAAAGFLANTYWQQGRLRELDNLTRSFIPQESGTQRRTHPAASYVYLEQGELLYERSDLDASEEALELAIQWGEITDRIVNGIRARLLLARIHLARGDQQQAARWIDQASGLFRQSSPRYHVMHQIEYDYYRIRCFLDQKNIPAALHWMREYETRRDLTTPWLQLAELVYARVLMASDQLDQALSVLSSCEQAARSFGATGWVIQSLMLQALCHQTANRLHNALGTLCHAMALAEPEGYVRTFVDEGRSMGDLLTLLLTRLEDYAEHPVTSRYVSDLLAVIKSESEQHATLTQPLTDRELDVLRLLSAGFSNQEIADQLVISLGTVKQYNHVIFRKLDVNTREEAKRRARERHLL